MYVLDTNTVIYYFKGVGNVAQILLSKSPQEIGIPSVVVYEIEVGIAKSTSPRKRTEQLQELLSVVAILPFSLAEARSAAGIRAKLEKQGKSIGPIDALIAGTAISNNARLVTHNMKEFSRVKGLQLEDWY